MRKLLSMALASIALSATAQERRLDNFVYRFNDSLEYVDRLSIRPDALAGIQLRTDSKRIPGHQVKFFQNNDRFFANTQRLTIIRNTSFAERIVEGKINLFQEFPNEFLVGGSWNRHRYRTYAEQPSLSMRMYYNKGWGDLKRVRYVNLLEDMADSPASLDLLKAYRKKVNTSTLLYASAGASIIGGMVMLLVNGSKTHSDFGKGFGQGSAFNQGSSRMGPSLAPGFILLGAGTGLAVGGFLNQISASRTLEDAIYNYNR
ncbi:MAG: hypothetical protein EOO90_09180 [Pedobacter sp.]|nr:MAG: hypothetical protein EOO90_09180 [Pedobacter sp.]